MEGGFGIAEWENWDNDEDNHMSCIQCESYVSPAGKSCDTSHQNPNPNPPNHSSSNHLRKYKK